ncbi:hypothetical protein SD427_08865 [Chryseobacterium sp. JJR-5R]|uniref:hypothetical protein n=1 Tax=Chryseobacterium sp. JJR-5R TaxID=3093923 RepID=UPI002A7533D2|nr:hypothetical protein [Chryseobacterium sp. JJR-5R]WPO84430.1 hypothetical protein SD427_08865 [Chryseobacterium sp. JJR-5R]
MKSRFFLFLMVCSGLASGQDIKPITKAVAEISQIKNYKVKTVPNSYFTDQGKTTDNGIELKGFYSNGQLRKMEHFAGLSAWNIVTQYFLSEKGELIFVYSKKYRTLNENGSMKKPEKISEARYYYIRGKLVKKLKVPAEQDPETNYLYEAKILEEDLRRYK